jgi:type IV pilus assembly protein PilM
VCAKKDVVDQMSVAQAANLLPFAVETDSFASVCALVHSGQIKKEEAVLFLDFGCQGCCVSIVINKQIWFKRDLAVSGDSLTQSIAKRCEVSYEEAECLKQKFGLINTLVSQEENSTSEHETAAKVNEALWLHLENLIQEVDYTSKYFSHQFTGGEVTKFDKVILSGGLAGLNNFSTYLYSYLGLPVEVADPLRGIEIDAAVSAKYENIAQISPRLTAVIGLALRDVSL